MNRALAFLAVVGVVVATAGHIVHPRWGISLALIGGMLMGFALGFWLAARTVRETLERRARPPKLKVVEK